MVKNEKYAGAFAGIILLMFALLGMYLGYLVLKGVFVPVLFAMLFAVVTQPFYKWVLKKTKSKIWSSLLSCLALVAIVIAVISFVIYLAVGEVVSVTNVFTQSLDFQSIEFLLDQDQIELLVNDTIIGVDSLLDKVPFVDTSSVEELISEILKNIPVLLQNLSSYIISIVKIGFDQAAKGIMSLMIFFISFFFLLIDGGKFVDYTFKLLPINALHERQISKKFTSLCYAWVVVNLLLAFIQGSMAAIGFAIIGVPSPLIWGIVTMFAAFIPFVGSGLVWASIAIIYLILGQYYAALFITIWGALLISSSDNILRPFFLKEGIKIHPLIVFLAVFGGFFAFGIPGLVIGPIIMVFISTLLYIYELEFGEVLEEFHSKNKKPKR
jgi:predicted PurR-regulated permease PerM